VGVTRRIGRKNIGNSTHFQLSIHTNDGRQKREGSGTEKSLACRDEGGEVSSLKGIDRITESFPIACSLTCKSLARY